MLNVPDRPKALLQLEPYAVQKISLAWYAKLGVALQPLLQQGGLDQLEIAEKHIQTAWPYLAYLVDMNGPLSMDASRPIIWALVDEFDRVLSATPEDRAQILNEVRANCTRLLSSLNLVLEADLGHQAVYHVYPKRAYSVHKLINEATSLFSEEVRKEFTEEETFNINEAGKCLAFEVPIAAAFHLFRAVDAILERYVTLVSGAAPKNQNWGAYIKNLGDAEVDKRITSVLGQLKDLHRNPIVHPELRLTVEESLSLVGIAESAISLMMGDIISRRGGIAPP